MAYTPLELGPMLLSKIYEAGRTIFYIYHISIVKIFYPKTVTVTPNWHMLEYIDFDLSAWEPHKIKMDIHMCCLSCMRVFGACDREL